MNEDFLPFTSPSDPMGLAVDGQYIYWADS